MILQTMILGLQSVALVVLAIIVLSYFIKNQGYMRDVFVPIICLMSLLINVTLVFFRYDILLTVLTTSSVLLFIFLLSNIKTTRLYWFSNILKSGMLAYFAWVVPINDIFHYQIFLTTLYGLGLIFIFLNKNSVVTTALYIAQSACALFATSSLQYAVLRDDYKVITWAVAAIITYNLVIIAQTSIRVVILHNIDKCK